MKPFCFADGQIISTEKASIHPMDLGFIRGYGIFDFFRTVNFKPLFLDSYLDRFFSSAEKTFLPLEYSRAELKAVIQELIEKNHLKEGGLRMVLSGGVSPNHFSPAKGKLFIFAESLIFPSQEKYEKGIKLLSLEYVRPIPEIKTTNYALSVWDSMRWNDAGAEDVLYYINGHVSESSRSNFFIVKNGIISTPDSHVLMGITRKHIIELAGKVQIRPISMQEALNADEAFISSTTKILLPVTQIDDHEIGNGKPGPVSLDLLAKFRDLERELCY
ncbi:branched-chain amino acid aminotransferase [Algoriphagus ratkowskyi]|uniref:branched-chain-amino-acid transaminase n=1 Tax=Algoriphagus ratkowskyi TaxID=57028 RepID=A0A2W7QTH9_9BACT|nr:aminotransferase class IV [Algoriphagus ratkowskyi]PZX50466.1 branched-chain amino acid aminotransferase [Algoriphagus ratkowskyi]TXD75724.1 branched-chain amino acid aminotransferase [Algoriphagus ratkowskyi]